MPLAPGVVTVGTIIQQAQSRVDMVSSSFIAPDEWIAYTNGSAYELYDILCQKFGDNYSVSETTFYTTGSIKNYALPQDHFKTLGVSLSMDGGDVWNDVPRFMWSERNRHPHLDRMPRRNGGSDLRYDIVGQNLMFAPTPVSSLLMQHYYVPRMATLSSSLQTVDGVSGWEELIVTDVAIKALQKQGDDVSALMTQKQMQVRRIENAAANRDAGSPQRIVTDWSRRLDSGW